jgi:hypothetical protein
MARTYIKAALRQPVGQGLEQGLLGRFTAAQPIEVNPMMAQVARTATSPNWLKPSARFRQSSWCWMVK